MGKSKAKSKVEKRKRTVKRALLKPMIDEQIVKNHEKIKMSLSGIDYREKPKKNGFRFPNDSDSFIPQHVIPKVIDFRSAKNPYSGTEMAHNFRNRTRASDMLQAKFTEEIIEEEEEKIKQESNREDLAIQNELLDKFLNLKVEKRIQKKKEGMMIEKNKKKSKFNKKSKSSKIIKF